MSTQRAAALCLALFVFAGYYKAADLLRFIPFDLTLAFWLATAGFCLHALWRQRRLPPGTLAILLVFAAMALGLHWPGDDLGSYPAQKELRLFSLTALSAAAPLLLLREDGARQDFLYAIGVLGAVMAVAVAVEVAASDVAYRLSAFNTNPILLARATGFTLLLLCLHYWMERIRLWVFLPAAAVAGFGLLESGSRGPLIAFIFTAAALAALCALRSRSRWRVAVTTVAGAAALVVAVLLRERANIGAFRRLTNLLAGEFGDSESSRLAIWHQTIDLIAASPLGVGWGKLTEHVKVVHAEGNLLLHPHNVILEIAVEAGWLAAAAFVILIGATGILSIRASFRALTGPTDRCPIRTLVVFASLSYWFFCAAFSGDVNDNRPLWAMIGMALAAQDGLRRVRAGRDRDDGESSRSRREPP